jgi:hypothetical protein
VANSAGCLWEEEENGPVPDHWEWKIDWEEASPEGLHERHNVLSSDFQKEREKKMGRERIPRDNG